MIEEGLRDGQEDPGRELRPARRGREGQVHDPGAGQPQGHRQGDGDAQREAGRVRGAARRTWASRGSRSTAAIVKKFEKLLVGGIWCIVTLEYFFEEDQKGSPFVLRDLKPIQMPNMDMEELFQGRRAFTEQQWIDVLLRSTGMEPTNFTERVKWHLLARMIPLVENNYNLCELGPTGHGQEPHLQGDQPEQHPGLRRADDRGEPVLQHGPPRRSGWSACGTWWPSTKWRASPSRTRTASRS